MRLLVHLCLLLIAVPALCNAQQKITGRVTDDQKKPIINGTLSLKRDNVIIKYTKTDENGAYTLSINSFDSENYIIEAKSLGYKTLKQEYKHNKNNYDFILYESPINLDSVIVKHKPVIIQKGDTLNYRTADFANQNDRSIGDVLKKMPGISVDDNGKVSYNDQPISNLYIDGDNLLDDKYNIGTKSIPYKAVTKIQVIDHDQPIKMLQKNNLSNDIAINLVIDKNAKVKIMGNAKIGGGLPSRYDDNLDMMLFKQELKFLNNISINNIGTDITDDVISHNNAFNINKYENNRPDFQITSGVGITPYLPKSKYLLNNSGIINTNNLYKLTIEKQLKVNIYYLYDQRNQNNSYQTQVQLPNETFTYAEQQYNRAINQSVFTQLHYIDNASTHYVNNTFRADYSPDKNKAKINGQEFVIVQNLRQKRLNLVNDLKYLRQLKSGTILNLNSYIEKNSQTEFLNITPGINENILNGGTAYNELLQRVSVPGFFTHNYINYSFIKGNFTQSYQAGFTFQDLNYDSDLEKLQGDNSLALLNNGQNNINWNRFKLYLNPGLDYKTDALKINIRLPLGLNLLKYNINYNSYKKIFANPSFSLQYKINQQTKFTTSYSFAESMGSVEAVFSGIVLQNYRSLVANNVPLPFTKIHRSSVGFDFQKAISMLFANIKFSYSRTILDNITKSTISKSIAIRNSIPYQNNIDNYTLSGSMGKYIVPLNTNLSFDIMLSQSNGEQLQNDYFSPYTSKSLGLGANISSKITRNINWTLYSSYASFKNHFNGSEGAELLQLRQFSNINVSIFKKITLGFNLNHIYVQQGGQRDLRYLFTDMNVKYKWIKIKTDFEVGFNNLNNIKSFSTYFINTNTITFSDYEIPGRYIMLKAIFAF